MFDRITNAWRYFRRPEVEFSDWETPFQNDEISILGVQYLGGGLDMKDYRAGFGFAAEDRWDMAGYELIVHLCSWRRDEPWSASSTAKIYALSFKWIGGFRVLDEVGLLELWEATAKSGGRPAHSTFRVRNHLWSRESPVPFLAVASDGWSFVVASGWDCIEVIARMEPEITLVEELSAYSL